jgi:hypothetical protein
VIEKIVDVRGEKRFKKSRGASQGDQAEAVQVIDMKNLNFKEAYKEFRKRTNTPHYA